MPGTSAKNSIASPALKAAAFEGRMPSNCVQTSQMTRLKMDRATSKQGYKMLQVAQKRMEWSCERNISLPKITRLSARSVWMYAFSFNLNVFVLRFFALQMSTCQATSSTNSRASGVASVVNLRNILPNASKGISASPCRIDGSQTFRTCQQRERLHNSVSGWHRIPRGMWIQTLLVTNNPTLWKLLEHEEPIKNGWSDLASPWAALGGS